MAEKTLAEALTKLAILRMEILGELRRMHTEGQLSDTAYEGLRTDTIVMFTELAHAVFDKHTDQQET